MSRIAEIIRNLLMPTPGMYPALSRSPFLHQEYFGHTIKLIDKGEIRFGPPYFDLLIDEAWIRNKVFGKSIWNLDDYMFGAEEWLTTSERNGPLTRLVIFDLERMRCAPMKRIHGFPESARIESSKLIYARNELNNPNEIEVALNEISNWSPIFGCHW